MKWLIFNTWTEKLWHFKQYEITNYGSRNVLATDSNCFHLIFQQLEMCDSSHLSIDFKAKPNLSVKYGSRRVDVYFQLNSIHLNGEVARCVKVSPLLTNEHKRHSNNYFRWLYTIWNTRVLLDESSITLTSFTNAPLKMHKTKDKNGWTNYLIGRD